MVCKTHNSSWLFRVFFIISVLVNCIPALDWWQTSLIYQIYPRSFKDSNGDGIGDLKGIEEKVEYLKDLGVTAVWLSPIFKSPMNDMGYDIADYKDTDSIFGTLDDFISLQKKLHESDIKLILDFVPNHSSDEHEWFKKSVQRIDPYTDYYVWRDPKSWNGTIPVPPNNWISLFEGSAWKYHSDRKQFYLHQFAEKQPDLNYHSKELLEEMKNVLRFWLDKGVNGFRMDAVPYLVEVDKFPDEPAISNATINGILSYNSLDHIYTKCLQKTYEILREFREVLDTYTKKDGQTRLMMTEAYASLAQTIEFYGNSTHPIAHTPFNMILLEAFNSYTNATALRSYIEIWLDNMPKGQTPNWVLGNHDQPRIATKFDSSSVDALNMLLLLLPGIAITYNGEEIGMQDTKIRWDQTTDIWALKLGPKLYATVSRDPARTPFQWNSSSHAGFSNIVGKTWLPVNPNYFELNVEAQKSDTRSHMNVYQALIGLRSKEVFQKGDLNIFVISDWIFAFTRRLARDRYIVVLNLNNEEERVQLNNLDNFNVIWTITITSTNSEYKNGHLLNVKDGFNMRPKSGLVLQENSKSKY